MADFGRRWSAAHYVLRDRTPNCSRSAQWFLGRRNLLGHHTRESQPRSRKPPPFRPRAYRVMPFPGGSPEESERRANRGRCQGRNTWPWFVELSRFRRRRGSLGSYDKCSNRGVFMPHLAVEHPGLPAQELHGIGPGPGFGRSDLLPGAVVVFLREPVEGVVQGLRGADLESFELGEVPVAGLGFLGHQEMRDADAGRASGTSRRKVASPSSPGVAADAPTPPARQPRRRDTRSA